MLRQILNDMYVDPEILSHLDEYQKQTLFCKMREEQIRRWRIREQENESRSLTPRKSTPNKKNKNVSFREDDEGEPWVVVIEPPAILSDSDSDDSDLSMKKPGHEAAKQRARELAEIETKELRRQYKEIISDYDSDSNQSLKMDKSTINEDDDPLGSPIIEDMEIYCSVDGLRDRMNQTKLKSIPNLNGITTPTLPTNLKNGELVNNQTNNIINFSFSDNKTDKSAILKEISNNKPSQKVSAKIALWEQRVIGEKTNEIYQRLRKKQKEAAEEEAKKQEEAWKEQERKAKEADIQYREIARRAREEYRKSLTNSTSDTTPTIVNGITKNGNVTNGHNAQNSQFKNGTNITPTKGPAPQPPKQPVQSSPPNSLDVLIPRPSSHEAMIQWYDTHSCDTNGSTINNNKQQSQ